MDIFEQHKTPLSLLLYGSYPIVALVFVAVGIYLLSRFLATGLHVTIFYNSLFISYPTALRCIISRFRVSIRVTLRLTVYSQSARLGAKPLKAHEQRFFFATQPLQ
jgi:hypothetical protein